MRTSLLTIGIGLIFLAGILAGSLNGIAVANTDNRERSSPSDWVQPEQIKVYKDHVQLDIPNVIWAEFTDTKSMDPVFDSTSHALEIVPKQASDINVGDIISYNSPYSEYPIIHRITEIGNDGQWYAIVKGDNNPSADPGKVRFENVNRVLIAIIY